MTIYTHRSHKAGSGTEPAFSDRAYGTLIRCLVINLAICIWLISGEGGVDPFVEGSRPVENDPCDAGNLVGKGDDNFVGVHAFFELIDPGTELGSVAVEVHHA